MGKIIDLIKKNWVSLALLLVIIFILGKGNNAIPVGVRTGNVEIGGFSNLASTSLSKSIGYPMMDSYQQATPVITGARMVVQDTSVSMQVNDVSKTLGEIEKLTTGFGGYMVNRSMVKPEGAATGNITIRVPIEKREEALSSIKKIGIKTVSENVFGNDVTDQYVDIQQRINDLNKTKAKMELLMDQSGNVSDLMNIQMQINNIQSQIDSYLGQQKYLEQTAKLTKIAVNLSTDELALPYAPDTAWRPSVVLKTAVRSMIGALRSLANIAIWTVVYLPIIVILGAFYWFANVVWKKYQKE